MAVIFEKAECMFISKNECSLVSKSFIVSVVRDIFLYSLVKKKKKKNQGIFSKIRIKSADKDNQEK